tara:strand:+ start:1681 stop:2418 length:738 start_codon:yes stop_codon:yes gene_type:complete
MIVCPVPAYGRYPLVRLTVDRLLNVNNVDKVILIGHEPEVKKIAEDYDCEFIYHENDLLGRKWNIGFLHCEKYNPDAVLFCGTSDWIGKAYLEEAIHHLSDFDMIGKLGCHFCDVRYMNDKSIVRLVDWKGYTSYERKNEPIGIGRVISGKMMKKMGWMPFNNNAHSGLDWNMWTKVNVLQGEIGILTDYNLKLLSLSTSLWQNKHRFDEHWTGILPSDKIIGQSMDKWLEEFNPHFNKLKKINL